MSLKNENIINWYKQRIESYHPSPPDHLWNNIQNDLDLDHAWLNIEKHLKRRKMLIKFRNTSLFLVLFAASIITVFELLSAHQRKVALQNQISESPKPENPPIQTIPSGSMQKSALGENIQPLAVPAYLINPKNTFSVQGGENLMQSIPSENLDRTDFKMSSLPPKNNYLIYVRSETNVLKNFDLRPSSNAGENIGKDNILSNTFYIGCIGSWGITSLLNDSTYLGLKKNAPTKTKLDFGYSLGIVMGWKFAPKNCLQFELLFADKGGQIYQTYVSDQPHNQEIALSYLTGNLIVKHMINKSTTLYVPFTSPILKRRVRKSKTIENTSNLLFGFYGNYLMNATETSGSQEQDLSDFYKSFDYGVIAGFEYNFIISNKIAFVPGIRLNIGLNNIIKENTVYTYPMSKTYRASILLNFGINYYFH